MGGGEAGSTGSSCFCEQKSEAGAAQSQCGICENTLAAQRSCHWWEEKPWHLEGIGGAFDQPFVQSLDAQDQVVNPRRQ